MTWIEQDASGEGPVMVQTPDHGGAMQGGAAVTNLHVLAANLAGMERLLRRTNEGLVRADPVLIRSAINLGREEMRRLRAKLTELPADPMDPWRPSLDEMMLAITCVDGLLDALEDMVRYASD